MRLIRKTWKLSALMLAAAAILVLVAKGIRGEGPLLVGGQVGVDGLPYKWAGSTQAFNGNTLSYWTDQGTLGTLTNSQANNLVAASFKTWKDVPTSAITFSRKGSLGADVTDSNFMDVQNAIFGCNTLPSAPAGGIAKPVSLIYDVDGSILTSLGEDPNSTLGEATAACASSNGTINYYARGFALLNGKGLTTADQGILTAVMTHEFGHLIGLDHSQVNLDCLNDTRSCFADGSIDGVPIMFPVLLQDINGQVHSSVALDDQAGLSDLYPEPDPPASGKVAFDTLGRIQGRVFFSDGVTPAQGFNVVARNVSNPRVTAVANISGYLFTEEVGNAAVPSSFSEEPYGSRNTALIGFFDIPGLPPGNYTVEVEALNNSGQIPFVGGSSAGPIGVLGFQFELPGTCTTHQFYVAPSSGIDACSSGTSVNVVAAGSGGAVTTGVDIPFIGTGPRYDAWEDGP